MENSVLIPGSEWVYFKLYTGAKIAEAVLKNELYGYTTEMIKKGITDKWFFIRYSDPDFHLRLRLRLKEARDFSCVFSRFYETFYPLVETGLIWNIQCDTYKREMERYGINTMGIIEDFFFIDSAYIISLLHRLGNENPEQRRWKWSLALIDSFLSAFDFEISQRKELLNSLAENHKKEFGFTHHQTGKQLNEKCRTYRKEIENAMLWENEESEAVLIIKARRQAIEPIAKKLTAMDSAGELQVSLQSLLASTIHMTMNRWFKSKNRLHEMVIYEFLSRYYTSAIAQKGSQ